MSNRVRVVPAPLAVTTALAIIAWAVAALAALSGWTQYRDIRESGRDISAIQISQLVDEFIADLLPFVVVAVGLTGVALMLGLVTIVRAVCPELPTDTAPRVFVPPNPPPPPQDAAPAVEAPAEPKPPASRRRQNLYGALISIVAIGALIVAVLAMR